MALRPAARCNTAETLHEDADCWDAACIGVARQHCSECKRVKNMLGYAEGRQRAAAGPPPPPPSSPSDVTPFPVMKDAGVVSVPCFTDIMDKKSCNHVD